MASITRANPYLEEILQDLDNHLAQYKGNVAIANDRLSKDDRAWIDEETMRCFDARYFISNYYAYRDEKEGFKGLYPLFDSQEIMYEEYRRLERAYGKVRALVLKARQMGSTTYNCAEFFHKTIFSEHINSIIVGQDEDQSTFIFTMYRSALDFLPWWMKPRIKSNRADGQLEFDEPDDMLRSQRPGLKTWVYADNARKPTGVGRGRTFGRALLSELAFWADGKQLSKSLFPTMNTPDGFYIMESTANGRNDFWHNLWRRAESGKVDWHPIFIPFYRRAITYSIPIQEDEGFKLSKEEVEFRDRIVKKENFIISDETFKWMRNKKEEFIATDGDDAMFSQEYTSEPEESFQSSATTAFPRGIISKLQKQTINPIWIGEIVYDHTRGVPQLIGRKTERDEDIPYPERENRFHIWQHPIKGERYTVGVDVSLGNDGGDYSCVQVVKTPESHEFDEQVACWHGLINPSDLAEVVFAIGWLYNEALVAVEVNSMGMVTNNDLLRTFEYENIYRFKRLDRLKNFMTDIIGWWTDEKSKRALMTYMSRSLLSHSIIIRDKHTVDEFNDFTEDGAIGEGAHDDYCFPPGTKVKTSRGELNIESVKVGDSVLSHDGCWNTVDLHGKREIQESLCVLRVHGIDRPIRCTGNHPILARKRLGSCPVRFNKEEWANADGIRKGDAVFVPVAESLHPPPLTDDELYLLGWILADGYVSKQNQVRITFAKDESVCAGRVGKIIEKIIAKHPTDKWCGVRSLAFQLKWSKVTTKEYGKYITVTCTSRWLAQWVEKWTGRAKNKFIHEQILKGAGTIPFVVGFIEGDGSQKLRRKSILIVQKNTDILRGIRDIMLRNGVWSGICPSKNRDGNHQLHIGAPWVNKLLSIFPGFLYEKVERKQEHPIAKWEGNGFWVTVKKSEREEYSGAVHNLSVENAHSYTAGELAVHNCMALMIAAYCGHEGEVTQRQGTRPRDTSGMTKFFVKDRFQTVVLQTTSQNEAERMSKRIVGSSIDRESSATATVVLEGKKHKVPADFQNTDHSPIHDRQGTAHKLHYDEDVPEELITPEMVRMIEENEDDSSEDPDAWMYS